MGRLVMVEVLDRRRCSSPAWRAADADRQRAREGFAAFSRPSTARMRGERLVAVRYVDSEGRADRALSVQPEWSCGGIPAHHARRRFTILMPHPERVRARCRCRGKPPGLAETRVDAMFRNARAGSADADCSATERKGAAAPLSFEPGIGLLDFGALRQLVGVGGHLLLLQRFRICGATAPAAGTARLACRRPLITCQPNCDCTGASVICPV